MEPNSAKFWAQGQLWTIWGIHYYADIGPMRSLSWTQRAIEGWQTAYHVEA